jgi:hypothetical protein
MALRLHASGRHRSVDNGLCVIPLSHDGQSPAGLDRGQPSTLFLLGHTAATSNEPERAEDPRRAEEQERKQEKVLIVHVLLIRQLPASCPPDLQCPG